MQKVLRGPRVTLRPVDEVEGVRRGGLLGDGRRHDVICMAALNPALGPAADLAGNAQVGGTV